MSLLNNKAHEMKTYAHDLCLLLLSLLEPIKTKFGRVVSLGLVLLSFPYNHFSLNNIGAEKK